MDLDEFYITRKKRIPVNELKEKKPGYELKNEIKKRIRLKSQLKESENKFNILTLSIQDAIIIIDYSQRVVNWNKAAEDMFGYTFREVCGKNLHKLITPPEAMLKADIGFKKFALTGSGRLVDKMTEVNAIKKDGTIFRAEISISRVKIKGKNHVVGIVRDVTERMLTREKIIEAIEAAEAANIAKSQFLANMSHEIRTPMNGIIGFMELLSETQLNSLQTDYLHEMKLASVSLLELINDLLDFSKIEANKMELDNVEFDLVKVINEVAAVFSVKARAKGIAFNVNIDSSIPALLRGDRRRLKQVIDNLVSNAVKFTKAGRVDIELKKADESAERVYILFRVADTGIGISGQDTGRLFMPFTQADASTTRKYGGTGLGLAISAKIVEMMSGKITAESEMGKGSVFKFTIGFDKAENYEKKKLLCSNLENTADTCNESWKSSARILLAEDNPTNQKLTVSILKSAGLSCDIAENGIEAVKAVQAAKYSLVLMDCQMPELDGYEATRLIRNTEAGERHLTIIAMTANALKSDYEKCIISGMDDYISKPFKTTELLNLIEKWINTGSGSGNAEVGMEQQVVQSALSLSDRIEAVMPEVCGTLDELAQDQKIDRDILYEIFYEFAGTLHCQLDKIVKAVDSSEFPVISMQAHTLKGASAGLRLGAISNMAAELEKYGREGDIVLCREAAHELLACCEKYESIFDA